MNKWLLLALGGGALVFKARRDLIAAKANMEHAVARSANSADQMLEGVAYYNYVRRNTSLGETPVFSVKGALVLGGILAAPLIVGVLQRR